MEVKVSWKSLQMPQYWPFGDALSTDLSILYTVWAPEVVVVDQRLHLDRRIVSAMDAKEARVLNGAVNYLVFIQCWRSQSEGLCHFYYWHRSSSRDSRCYWQRPQLDGRENFGRASILYPCILFSCQWRSHRGGEGKFEESSLRIKYAPREAIKNWK